MSSIIYEERMAKETVDLIKKENLCIGCGICSVICPNDAIELSWNQNQTWEPKIDFSNCNQCGICYKKCPNSPVILAKYAQIAKEHGEKCGLPDTGHYYLSYDLNERNRLHSASGGTLSAVSKFLLERGLVDAIITSYPLNSTLGNPHFEMRIIDSVQELDKSRSSHYHPLCYEEVLKVVQRESKTYAVVGVPCIIRGLTNLPENIRCKIKFTFCPVCSHNVSGCFSDYLAVKENIQRNEHFRINLRMKDTNMADANNFYTFIKSNSKEIKRNRFESPFTRAWRNYFFAFESCLYCPDFYGIDADLSVKDAWGRFSDEPLGISLLIIRNPQLNEILTQMQEEGFIFLKKCDADEILNSQKPTSKFKHIDVFKRFSWKKSINLEIVKFSDSNKLSRINVASITHIKYLLFLKFTSKIYNKTPISSFEILSEVLLHTFDFGEKILQKGIKLKKYLEYLLFPIIHRIKAIVFNPISIQKTSKNNDYSVVISGGYGYKNVGDEAQLAANLKHWRDVVPNVEINILSPNPQYTKNTHNEQANLAPRVIFFNSNKRPNYGASNIWFKWNFALVAPYILINSFLFKNGWPVVGLHQEEIDLIKSISKANVLHLCGGGYLTGPTSSRLWDNMLLIRIADILETPCILSGHTIGVFNSVIHKKIASWGLKKAKLIYLRDPEGSIRDLNSIGLNGDHIKVTFDDALFCETVNDDIVNKYLFSRGFDPSCPYVVVNVHYFKQKYQDSRRIMKTLAEICDYVIDKYGKQIVFIPMHPSDEDACNEVRLRMFNDAHVVEYDYDYKFIRGIIKKSVFCITMKHHPIIFAMGNGVPTIAIALDDYYQRKNEGALSFFGQEKWIINKTDLFDKSCFKEIIDAIIDDNKNERDQINLNLNKLIESDGEAIKRYLIEYEGIKL
ncbi:polysaccharide pyruvyl transferase family protein [Methanocalculus sp.]|uniref:polysaccharide pyruvyl transferase family protein n=1 Tax=Methanocalculus sp. TaxID=2004547 RepID=UPI00260D2062|nr:polysaccharide pyruvyl transferase family protein [Methanocalculus sp.]MDG6250215.1 polysaccharide pyruvyl transferase family protein [Methanocalculus sp.]